MTRVNMNRKLAREACSPGPRSRPIILEIEWPNMLHFREKGTRTRFTTTFEACWMMAVKAHVASAKREKAEARKAKKAGRR